MAIAPSEIKRFEDELSEAKRAMRDAEVKRDEAQVLYHESSEALIDAAARVENLRMVVRGLRGLAGETGDHADSAEPADKDPAAVKLGIHEAATPPRPRATYGGRPSIPSVILDVLGDGREHALDQIYRLVATYPGFADRPPSRGSVTNRLNDMAQRGEIVKVRRGVFKLVPIGDAGNGSVPGIPTLGGQLADQQSPGEQLIPAHPGQPDDNLEGAPGVVHRAGD